MPRFLPDSRFSDCWSSVGDRTYYHIKGKCYWRRKSSPVYPCTPEQQYRLELHRRAIAAWRSLDDGTQSLWNGFATEVPAHRPPFLGENHISGYNLFVSAYHGFAQMGDEHTPEPQPFSEFPQFRIDGGSASVSGRDLLLKVRLWTDGGGGRFRLLGKIFISGPGGGCRTSGLRSFLAAGDTFTIPDYRELYGLDEGPEYRAHIRYLLLDSVTGCRCDYRRTEFPVCI